MESADRVWDCGTVKQHHLLHCLCDPDRVVRTLSDSGQRRIFCQCDQCLLLEQQICFPDRGSGGKNLVEGICKNLYCLCRDRADSEQPALNPVGRFAGDTGNDRADNQLVRYDSDQFCAE